MPHIEPMPFGDLPPDVQGTLTAAIEQGRFSTSEVHRLDALRGVDAVRETLRRAEMDWARAHRDDALLEPRLVELVRLRCALLLGCTPCSSSRKDGSVGDAEFACLVGDSSPDGAAPSPAERAALEFASTFVVNHFAITRETFATLAMHFSAAQIVELGTLTARFAGAHRWNHVVGVLEGGEPVIAYDPAQVGRRAPGPVEVDV